MATYARTGRRGLPRVAGGEPWPPAGSLPEVPVEAPVVVEAPVAEPVEASGSPVAVAHPSVAEPVEASGAPRDPSPSVSVASPEEQIATGRGGARVRRGLPRVAGGEPWPPAASIPQSHIAATPVPEPVEGSGAPAAGAPAAHTRVTGPATVGAPVPERVEGSGTPAPADAAQTVAAATSEGQIATGDADVRVRRGLPRVAGGDPWPPAGFVPRPGAVRSTDARTVTTPTVPSPDPGTVSTSAPVEPSTAQPHVAPAATETAPAPVPALPTPAAGTGPRSPLPFTPTVFPGAAASVRPALAPEPRRIGPYTVAQWAGVTVVGGFTLLVLAAFAVVITRFLLSTPPLQEFLAAFPGEYHLPEGAPVGIPAWLGWQHFFNVFLMVLIIRTGLRVRTEKRPTVFWSPRGNKRRKISLALWFHQALDVLWVANGLIYVILLFATGQWVRIVPTSWEVIPNALSAALQYVSLDWPTENGWVNYNSLQQLAYFATVFVAAPLAIITGVRMSGFWPKNAATLNRLYPVEWARKVHFPVMVYFVIFIVFHVALVFATGALRNLNHMYAAQGSVDPNAFADNWTGFWIFVASIAVIVAGWVAARPLILAPIARLFGTVASR